MSEELVLVENYEASCRKTYLFFEWLKANYPQFQPKISYWLSYYGYFKKSKMNEPSITFGACKFKNCSVQFSAMLVGCEYPFSFELWRYDPSFDSENGHSFLTKKYKSFGEIDFRFCLDDAIKFLSLVGLVQPRYEQMSIFDFLEV